MQEEKVPVRQLGKVGTTVLVGVALLICYALTWIMFLNEGHPAMSTRSSVKNGVALVGHVIAADLAKDTITLSMLPDVTSPGLLVNRGLSQDIEVEIDTTLTVLSHKFKKGEPPLAWVVTLPIQDGDLTEFPVDNYIGGFTLKAGIAGGEKSVPKLIIDKVLHGYKFKASSDANLANAEAQIEFSLSRSPAVIFLAVMAMLSLTIVVCSAVIVAWQVAVKGRKLEFGMMVWMAALLFVIPAVRGSIPGSPPPGAMVDVGLFFWLHVLAVVSLLTLVATWVKNKPALA